MQILHRGKLAPAAHRPRKFSALENVAGRTYTRKEAEESSPNLYREK
jgi:hypothetical protein